MRRTLSPAGQEGRGTGARSPRLPPSSIHITAPGHAYTPWGCCPCHKPEGWVRTSHKTKTTFRSIPGSFLESVSSRRQEPAPAASGTRAAAASKDRTWERASFQGRVPTKPAGSPERPPVRTGVPLLPTKVRSDTGTRYSHWPSVLTRGTLRSSLRTSVKVRREGQGLAQAERTALQAVGVCRASQQALTRPGRGTERAAGSRNTGDRPPQTGLGQLPGPRRCRLPRAQGGLPIMALHDRGLRGHSTLRKAITKDEVSEAPRTPKVAWIKDACLQAHSGAAGRDPSCQSLLPSSRNANSLGTQAASILALCSATGPAETKASQLPGLGRRLPPKPAAPLPAEHPCAAREPAAHQHRRPVSPKLAGEEAGRAAPGCPASEEAGAQHRTAGSACRAPRAAPELQG